MCDLVVRELVVRLKPDPSLRALIRRRIETYTTVTLYAQDPRQTERRPQREPGQSELYM